MSLQVFAVSCCTPVAFRYCFNVKLYLYFRYCFNVKLYLYFAGPRGFPIKNYVFMSDVCYVFMSDVCYVFMFVLCFYVCVIFIAPTAFPSPFESWLLIHFKYRKIHFLYENLNHPKKFNPPQDKSSPWILKISKNFFTFLTLISEKL